MLLDFYSLIIEVFVKRHVTLDKEIDGLWNNSFVLAFKSYFPNHTMLFKVLRSN